MADHTVTVIGPLALAEEACVSIFGEVTELGPVRRAPAVLLEIVKKWPGRTDEPLNFTLQLPWTFDIAKEIAKNHAKAVVLRGNLVTVLHQGKAVGKALRLDAPSLGSLDAWERAWAVYNRKIRQAH